MKSEPIRFGNGTKRPAAGAVICLCFIISDMMMTRTAIAQCGESKLQAWDARLDDDRYGWAGDMTGPAGQQVVIVGALWDDDQGIDSGSAYVYRFDVISSMWIPDGKLLPSNGLASDQFGFDVAIGGLPGQEIAVVGAWNDNNSNGLKAGSVYVYRYDDVSSSWLEEARLQASDGEFDDRFGSSVSIHVSAASELIIVGAPRFFSPATDEGAAYIFRFDDVSGTWLEDAALVADDGVVGDEFGAAVTIGDGVAIVGAQVQDALGLDSGAAYVYRYDTPTSQWILEQKLMASDGDDLDWFGNAVAIGGVTGSEVAVIGAQFDDGLIDSTDSSGSAYVFRRGAGPDPWVEESRLLASDAEIDDLFGFSVDIDTDRLAVSAISDSDDGFASGSVYVFDFDAVSGTWSQQQKVRASDATTRDSLGTSVALSDGFLLATAARNVLDPTLFGRAYVIVLALSDTCAADTNCDFSVNVTDLLDLLMAWGPCPAPPNFCPADTNRDDEVNVNDLLSLLMEWGPCG